ncbi:hypothetical protein ACHQM5_003822 [Ranunculus cassubicifolius]
MDITLKSVWREVNFGADKLAKRGAGLPNGVREEHLGRPSWLTDIESPDKIYYRFS